MKNYQKYGILGTGMFLWLALINFSNLISRILEGALMGTNLNAFVVKGGSEYFSFLITVIVFLSILRRLKTYDFEEEKTVKKILKFSIWSWVITSVFLIISGFSSSFLSLSHLEARVEYFEQLNRYKFIEQFTIDAPILLLDFIVFPVLIIASMKSGSNKVKGRIVISSLTFLLLVFVFWGNAYVSSNPVNHSEEKVSENVPEEAENQYNLMDNEPAEKLDLESGEIAVNGEVFDFDSKEKLDMVNLDIVRDGEYVESVEINESGILNIHLDYDYTYTLTFKRKGYNSKKVVISTLNIPDDEKDKGGYHIPFEMYLQKDITKSISAEVPAGIYKYDSEYNDLIYDEKYTEFVKSLF